MSNYDRIPSYGMGPLKLRDQLRIPPITMEFIKSKLQLPDRFLGAATLREGSIVTLILIQTKCIAFLALAGLLLYYKPWYDWAEVYWREKFKADFDPYIQFENTEFINQLWPLWDDILFILLVIHGVYFVTGFGVTYALAVKKSSPFWYLPWLLMSGLMVAGIFLIGGAVFVGNIYIATYRYLGVTWDVVPMILVFCYATAWAYGFFITLAHYKRRCIVKYWKESQAKLGNLNF